MDSTINSAPSERDYYNAGAITSHGYFLLEPDIFLPPSGSRTLRGRLRWRGSENG